MQNFRLFPMLILILAVALTGCQQPTETPASPTPTEVAGVPDRVEAPSPSEPEPEEAEEEEASDNDLGLPAAPVLQPEETPTPTEEPEPPVTPEPTPTGEPSEEEPSPEQTVPPEATAPPEVTEGETEPEETTEVPAPTTERKPPTTEGIVSTSALVIRDDETPAPPLIVTVSANREFPGYNFLITGLVRNGGSENYAGLDIIGTFFRADGSRHGPIEVNLQCPVLAPGDACPFRIDANAKGLTEVMLHPEGYPTTRATAEVNVTNIRTSLDGIGYVHITGSATNPNPVPVWDITLNGTLVDATGAIVSLGTDVLVGSLAAGATATFDVPVRYQPYTQYQLFVYAEPR
ncbi:MAG: hypothetical protein JXC32_09155 [Anaerolineae bacterium]|nr:hypothetical protein [Anaerolineae bacterium]